MFGKASTVPGAEEGAFWESRGKNVATQFATTGKDTYFGIYRRLEQPTSKWYKPTKEDKAQFFKQTGDISITSHVKVRDLEPYCTWTRLTYQPDGLLNHWYYGRIVLCGESVMQVTSLAGMGFNAALQSAVVLVNNLHESLKVHQNPGPEVLGDIFKAYQDVCALETREVSELSASYIRGVTWSTWVSWFFVKYVAPIVWGEEGMIKRIGRNVVAKGHRLGHLHHKQKVGKIPWKN